MKSESMEHIEKEPGLQAGRLPGRLAWGFVLLMLLAGIVLVALDWRKFAAVLAGAEWRPLLAAAALTAVSYFCTSAAFAVTARLLGIRMGFRALTETGFVSIVLNHVLTAGGVAGYSVRYFLMRRHGVEARDILAASLLHIYLTSLDMITMLPVGFLYLFLNASLPRGMTAMVGLMTLVMAAAAAIATALIFVKSLRRWVIRLLARLGRRLLQRDLGAALQRFDGTLARGVDAMYRRPVKVVKIMALTWIDWFASLGVVWLCFDALGEPMSFGVILAGYVIGVMAGALSMVPGGLGVQEGSMTGVFVLLGASFQQALLASILFRGIYFLLPYGVSLVFYGRLLRNSRTGH